MYTRTLSYSKGILIYISQSGMRLDQDDVMNKRIVTNEKQSYETEVPRKAFGSL